MNVSVDYKNLNNIVLNVRDDSNIITGYTTYGGYSENANSYYFENAKELLPDDFFTVDDFSDRFILLQDPYEVRKNPDYEKIKEQKEEEERKRREESADKDTVSREEYEKLKAELEEIKKLLKGGK